jgi:hypothetical protein
VMRAAMGYQLSAISYQLWTGDRVSVRCAHGDGWWVLGDRDEVHP